MKKIYSILLLSLMVIGLSLNVSAQDLLVYYNFDESDVTDTIIDDFSGNHNDGIASGDNATTADSSWVEGKFNNAFKFDDGNDVVIDLPAGDIGLTSEEGTVAFWALIPTFDSTSMNTIFWASMSNYTDLFAPHPVMHIHTENWGGGASGGDGSAVSCVVYDSVNAKQYFLFSDPGNRAAGSLSENALHLTDSAWHHFATTWGNGYLEFYIDGLPMHADSIAYDAEVWDYRYICLGQQNGSSSRSWKGGIIDEFRIYDESLDDIAIDELYKFDPTSVSDIKRDALSTYPNPAQNVLNISGVAAGLNYAVYSITGQVVSTGEFNGTSISVGQLPAGTYMLKVGTEIAKFNVSK